MAMTARARRAAIAAVALAAGASRADFASEFDCAARTLAVEFAYQLQPFRPASFYQGVADALNGTPEKAANCTVSVPPALLSATAGRSRFRHAPLSVIAQREAAGGFTFYVDPVNGSDGNPGTDPKAPLKSIPAAVTASRAAGSGANTIVLRAGTHYPGQTIVLTPSDSGLQFMSYPGEEAWISGGVPLVNITWQPYKVSPGGDVWRTLPNTSLVNAAVPAPGQGSPGIPFLGYVDSAVACQQQCQSTGGCTAWTWHDSTTGEWAKCCYGRLNSEGTPMSEAGHTSGQLQPASNIWAADVSGALAQLPNGILGLRAPDGTRLQRARYPSFNSEVSFGPYFSAGWTPQQAPAVPDVQIDLPASYLSRNTTLTLFKTFTAGIGGTCDRFDPPAGYWCSQHVQGGGSQIYAVPIAMNVTTAQLPHTPYANPIGAVIMTWRPGHWASWMAQVTGWEWDAATNGTNFTYVGLFQGSRGADSGDSMVYIENVFEELDAPGEWFYNASTQTLYLWNNASAPAPPPADGSIAVASLKALFNVTGNQSNPVVDVGFTGIGFRDTAYTYMDPHSIPSGGDWTLERTAVVFAEGTRGFTVSGCVFERVDGNALLLSGYARNASITYNEFAWTGASAIATWGNTYGGDDRLPPGYGAHGEGGDQPRGTLVAENYCHDYGIWQKQSSCYTQFKTSESVLRGNVFLNGPRAHINHNDGFRGGGVIEGNLLANSCRESSDHGPFNSWDRDPYTFDLPDGSISTTRMPDTIAHNFIFANYFSLSSVDNDDGSNFYNITGNVQLYGNGHLKNDFEGHSGHGTNNLVAFVQYAASNGYSSLLGTPGQAPYQLPGYTDSYVNNTVYMTQDNSWGYAHVTCSGSSAVTLSSNTVYSPDPAKAASCPGNDNGSVFLPQTAADSNAFIALARSVLAEATPAIAQQAPEFA